VSYHFALIGCGRIAGRHAPLITKWGTLIAVCDPDLQRRLAFGARYQCPAFGSAEALFAGVKPDIAVICSPNGLHADHVLRSFSAGCHVLCEKPLALNIADATKIIEASQTSQRSLFIVRQVRYNPLLTRAKTLISEGYLGRISGFQINCFWNRPDEYYLNSWRGSVSLDGGTLFNQFGHFIDLIYWFFGEIAHVTGTRQNFQHAESVAFEDAGVAQIRMKSGAIGGLHYTINAFPENIEGSLTILGEKGTIKIGGTSLNVPGQSEISGMTGNQIFPEVNPDHVVHSHEPVYADMIAALMEKPWSIDQAYDAMKCVEMTVQIYDGSPLLHFNPRR
jgi:UDP-N-acetyl-2-amino-2-deoxyglucuronate dehydrogenase